MPMDTRRRNLIMAHTIAVRLHGQTNPPSFYDLTPLEKDTEVVWTPGMKYEAIEDAGHLRPTGVRLAPGEWDTVEFLVAGHALDVMSILAGRWPSDIVEDATQGTRTLKMGGAHVLPEIEMWIGGKEPGATYGMFWHFFKGGVTEETAKSLVSRAKEPTLPAKFRFGTDPDLADDDPVEEHDEDESPPPAFTREVSPITGASGSTLTFYGKHFGATQGTSKIYIGVIPVTSVTSWSDTVIVCTAPAGIENATHYACQVKISDTKASYATVDFLGIAA